MGLKKKTDRKKEEIGTWHQPGSHSSADSTDICRSVGRLSFYPAWQTHIVSQILGAMATILYCYTNSDNFFQITVLYQNFTGILWVNEKFLCEVVSSHPFCLTIWSLEWAKSCSSAKRNVWVKYCPKLFATQREDFLAK